jgi:RNA polymerase sigma-70 factor (ECF subfamily)
MFDDDGWSQYRPLLFSIAYRMLGSVMDAEDIVQEAYLRWRQVDTAAVESPKAYLTRIVTRLCIDQLRSAHARREEYIGPWLPEPLITGQIGDATELPELAESLSMAFLVLLESLTPVERAVFLLHDIFGYEYDELARIVDKSEANCRQIARRARQHVQERRPRFTRSPDEQQRITNQFIQTCSTGDMAGLMALLSDDISVWTDGGGKAQAARRPVHGQANAARFIMSVVAKAPPGYSITMAMVNGQPAIVSYVYGQPIGVLLLEIAEERITAIHVVVNPEKLRHLRPLEDQPGA